MNFADLLDALAYQDGERLSLSRMAPDGEFEVTAVDYDTDAAGAALAYVGRRHGWFNVNPVRAGLAANSRGTADDVTRLAAVWADIDVKDGACADLEHANQVVAAISEAIGEWPTAVVHSGGGLQPYWPIEDGQIDTAKQRDKARATLARFGYAVQAIGREHGARLDSVFDLARILRIPGTTNPKYDEHPAVTATAGMGGPMTVDQLSERLDELGVPDYKGDAVDALDVAERVSEWRYVERTCGYLSAIIDGIAGESSELWSARHPRMLNLAVRFSAAHRHGCLTENDHRRAITTVSDKLKSERARTGETVGRLEVSSGFAWAVDRVSRMPDDELGRQIGSDAKPHTHGESGAVVNSALVALAGISPPPAQGGGNTSNAAPTTPVRKFRIVKGVRIHTTVPRWAWRHDDQGGILNAALTLFGGRPGAGKSTTARWFAAGWTAGTIPGCFEGKPIEVAYVATEEAWDFMVAPSLQAAGADMNKINFIAAPGDDNYQPARIDAKNDQDELIAEFTEAGVRAVVLDPLMSTISGKTDVYRTNEVREYVDPWIRVAEAIDGPVVGITHMTKSPTGDIVASLTGSSAFGELARCIWGFAVDRDAEDGTRIMTLAKNSAGAEGLNLAYRLGGHRLATTDGEVAEMARFELIGPTERSVRELLIAERSSAATSGTDECARWLKGYLQQHGQTPRIDLASAATEFGFSLKMLKTAARRIGVLSEQTREVPSRALWSLPATADGQ